MTVSPICHAFANAGAILLVRAAFPIGLAILSGCGTTGAPVPEKVLVPVIKPCVENPPAKPATTDEKALLSMDDYAATISVWTERLVLKAYSEKADAALQACK